MFKNLFSKKEKNHEECSICLDDIASKCKKTSCGHKFHKHCLKQWMKENNVCPICRKENPTNMKPTRKDRMEEKDRLRTESRRAGIEQITRENMEQGFIYNSRFLPPSLAIHIDSYFNNIRNNQNTSLEVEMDYANSLICIYLTLFKNRMIGRVSAIPVKRACEEIISDLVLRLEEMNAPSAPPMPEFF